MGLEVGIEGVIWPDLQTISRSPPYILADR